MVILAGPGTVEKCFHPTAPDPADDPFAPLHDAAGLGLDAILLSLHLPGIRLDISKDGNLTLAFS